MMYDVTDPDNPEFIQYINSRNFNASVDEDGEYTSTGDVGDCDPEGIVFVSADDSPIDSNLLIVGNETSGTVSIYTVD